MEIREIAPEVQGVGSFMSRIKPEWWPTPDTAVTQLQGGTGWFASENQEPTAWLLCKYHPNYKIVEIDCMGYDNQGRLDVGPPLAPLVQRCQEWSKENGAVNIAYIIGSASLSCHGQKIHQPWQQLRDLTGFGSGQYNWLLSLDFVPSGLLPDTYAPGHHGVLLVKSLN